MSKSNIGPARVDKPSQASHRRHELLAEFTVERFRVVNFLRNRSCPLLEVFELEHLESRRDALGHGEVDVVIIHRHFHAKMQWTGVGKIPGLCFGLRKFLISSRVGSLKFLNVLLVLVTWAVLVVVDSPSS